MLQKTRGRTSTSRSLWQFPSLTYLHNVGRRSRFTIDAVKQTSSDHSDSKLLRIAATTEASFSVYSATPQFTVTSHNDHSSPASFTTAGPSSSYTPAPQVAQDYSFYGEGHFQVSPPFAPTLTSTGSVSCSASTFYDKPMNSTDFQIKCQILMGLGQSPRATMIPPIPSSRHEAAVPLRSTSLI